MRARVKRAPKLRGVKRLVTFAFIGDDERATLLLPILTVSESNRNTREHFSVAGTRHKTQKTATRSFLREAIGAGGVVYRTVKLTRLATQALDSDNLPPSMKYIRDELARWMGVDDGPKGPVTWEYDQCVSGAYGVLVELRK